MIENLFDNVILIRTADLEVAQSKIHLYKGKTFQRGLFTLSRFKFYKVDLLKNIQIFTTGGIPNPSLLYWSSLICQPNQGPNNELFYKLILF